jgi:DNA-binding transcriptional MerR regulator
MKRLTVSQIARRTGVTVRALHHYEALGLLLPAARSDAGYRLYGERELLRLQHIASLKALGFTLEEVRACLDGQSPSLGEALARQVQRLRADLVRRHDVLARLERLAGDVAAGRVVDTETLLNGIEASTLMEKYLSPEQMQAIRRRGEALGPERIRAVENEWPDLIAGMRAAMQLGRDPADADVQALARRWRALVREFTGGDPGIQQATGAMFRGNPEAMRERTGIDPALMAYACSAIGTLPD